MKRYPIVIAAALLLGCESGLTPSEGVRIETLDATVERVPTGGAVSARVAFRVVNASDAPMFVAQCGGRVMTAVDRRETDGGWTQYSGDGCLAILDMSPMELAPNAGVEGDRWIAEAGVYRLRVGSSASPSATTEWRAVSNPFVVR